MSSFTKAPSVKGFKKISFWREESVGIITLLAPGTIDKVLAGELISAFSLADSDEKVKSLLITGSNYVFSKGLSIPESPGYADLRDYYDVLKALTLFLLSIEKPVFSAINGIARNNGISLAFLSDEVFYSSNTKIELDNEEPPILLSALTYPKRINIDGDNLKVRGVELKDDEMMKEALEASLKLSKLPYYSGRKERFRGFDNILLQEEIHFLDHYLWCEGCKDSK